MACALLLILAAPASATATAPADDGARVVNETRVDDRTIDLVIDSPAFPQLWLLHGCCSEQDVPPTPDYLAWTAHTGQEEPQREPVDLPDQVQSVEGAHEN